MYSSLRWQIAKTGGYQMRVIRLTEQTERHALYALEYLASCYANENSGCVRTAFTLWEEGYLFDAWEGKMTGTYEELSEVVRRTATFRRTFWTSGAEEEAALRKYRFYVYIKEYTDPTLGRYDSEAFVFGDLSDATAYVVDRAERALEKARRCVRDLVNDSKQLASVRQESVRHQQTLRQTQDAMNVMREEAQRMKEELEATRKMLVPALANARIRKTENLAVERVQINSRVRVR